MPQQPAHVSSSTCRRVAVLDCEDAERWLGYTEQLWKEALAEEGDTWDVFWVSVVMCDRGVLGWRLCGVLSGSGHITQLDS